MPKGSRGTELQDDTAHGRKAASDFSETVIDDWPVLHMRLLKSSDGRRCQYEWVNPEDPAPRRLVCKTHKENHSIIRWNFGSGHDVLIDLYEDGLLTGKALEDGRTLAQAEVW